MTEVNPNNGNGTKSGILHRKYSNKDVLLNKIEQEYICCDKDFVINDRF